MDHSTALTKAANKLELRPERHAAFATLILHHLRTTATWNPQDLYGSAVHLDAATLSFLALYGGQIWTAYSPMRAHLTNLSTVPTEGRGLFHAEHTQLKKGERKRWKDANENREPTETEEVLGSRLGKAMRAYLGVLLRDAVALDTGQRDPQVSVQDLLKAVVYTPENQHDKEDDTSKS